jgi:hypothetical protein
MEEPEQVQLLALDSLAGDAEVASRVLTSYLGAEEGLAGGTGMSSEPLFIPEITVSPSARRGRWR